MSRSVLLVLAFAALLSAVAVSCSSDPAPVTRTPVEADGGVDAGGDSGDAGAMDDEDAGQTEDAGTSPPPDAGEIEPVVRFVAIGDTGKGNDGQYQVAAAIKQKCAQSGCDFVVMLGDNIYDSGVSSATDDQFRTKFEEPYAEIDLPFWAVLGNHDYGGNGTGNEFNKGQYEVQYSQHSTKWKMPAPYYRFTHKHVEFFATDTNMQMYGLDGQQETDVAKWISESTAVWKIVLGHHPFLSNGPHGNAGEYDGVKWVPIANGAGVKSFAEDVWCGKADVSLTGHDHSVQYLKDTCAGTELLVSGAAASVTTLPGTNPVHFQAADLGFVWVELKGRTFTAERVDVTGATKATRSFSK